MKPTTKNRAFIGAYYRGAVARSQGVPITMNPYKDLRTYGGSVTFARAFMRYWAHGWEDGDTTNSRETA